MCVCLFGSLFVCVFVRGGGGGGVVGGGVVVWWWWGEGGGERGEGEEGQM